MTAAWRNSYGKLLAACLFLNADELDTLLAFVLEKIQAVDKRRQAAALPPVMIAGPEELQ